MFVLQHFCNFLKTFYYIVFIDLKSHQSFPMQLIKNVTYTFVKCELLSDAFDTNGSLYV